MEMYCVCWCSAASLSVVGALMFAFSAIEVLYRTKTLNPCPTALTYFFAGAEAVFGVTFVLCIPICYFTDYEHESLLRGLSFILLAILVLIVAIMFTVVSISLSYNSTRRAAMGSQVTWELCRICTGVAITAGVILSLLAVQLPGLLHFGPIKHPELRTFDAFDSEAPGLLTYIITVLFFIMVSAPRRSAQKPGVFTSPSQYRYSVSGGGEKTLSDATHASTMRPTASNPSVASVSGKPVLVLFTPSPKTSSRALPTQPRSGSISGVIVPRDAGVPVGSGSGTTTPSRVSVVVMPKSRAAVSPGPGLANVVSALPSPSATAYAALSPSSPQKNNQHQHQHTKSGGWAGDPSVAL